MEADSAWPRKLLDQFVLALEQATGKAVTVIEVAFDGDARAEGLLRLASGQILSFECRRAPYPRDIREAIFKLRQPRNAPADSPRHAVDQAVLISPHLTESARTLLREGHFGYFDGSGSMHLEFADLLIHIDRPSPKQAARRTRSVHAGASGSVVLEMLQARGTWQTGAELAIRSGTSTFTVSQTVNELARLDLIETKGEGRALLRRLTHPDKVLDEWAAATRSRREATSHWYLFAQDPTTLLHTMAQKIGRDPGTFITGAAAANHYAPWLTSIDVVDVVVPPGASQAVAAALELKPAKAGFNVRLIERVVNGTSSIQAGQVGDAACNLASPLVAYADTLDGRGRNNELAQHLRATVLGVDPENGHDERQAGDR
ncbi:type IV toxin-antitoxin system AbiEi family antitoxin [Rhizobacter sp. P5_C2]